MKNKETLSYTVYPNRNREKTIHAQQLCRLFPNPYMEKHSHESQAQLDQIYE